jgi:hypothetical protein
MNKRNKLRELKAELERRRGICKECDRWECGHCAEPIARLEKEITWLAKGGAAFDYCTAERS